MHRKVFLDGIQIFWRTVTLLTQIIDTKRDILKCILNVMEGEAFNSFPITSYNHIMSFLLSDMMTQKNMQHLFPQTLYHTHGRAVLTMTS